MGGGEGGGGGGGRSTLRRWVGGGGGYISYVKIWASSRFTESFNNQPRLSHPYSCPCHTPLFMPVSHTSLFMPVSHAPIHARVRLTPTYSCPCHTPYSCPSHTPYSCLSHTPYSCPSHTPYSCPCPFHTPLFMHYGPNNNQGILYGAVPYIIQVQRDSRYSPTNIP